MKLNFAAAAGAAAAGAAAAAAAVHVPALRCSLSRQHGTKAEMAVVYHQLSCS